MKKELHIGTLMSGAPFTLPLDFSVHTLAVIGQRGWGKTVAATVIAEEMCEAGLPWVAIDPVSVWWGLRCNPDGTPGGYPIVIIGGDHADIPLDKDGGSRVADAILQENVSCIIDLAQESKNTWRKFVTDFCERLMELRPAVQRFIWLEEAPEFVPQRPMGEQKRTLGAVERLGRLGRNNGYGLGLISQRTATIHKDILTQSCESILAGRVIGKSDRDAFADWIAEVVHDTESSRAADKFMKSLVSLPSGQGWFWSPQYLERFEQVRIRQRKTYHPGATRNVGQAPAQVQLSDVREFVERFGKVLNQSKPVVMISGGKKTMPKEAAKALSTLGDAAFLSATERERFQSESTMLRSKVAELSQELGKAKAVIASLQKQLEPEYRAMQKLFGDIEQVGANGHVDVSIWEPWKAKLGAGPAKLIDILVERGKCTRVQLQTLSGYSRRTMQNHISALNSNQLIEKEGSDIVLRKP